MDSSGFLGARAPSPANAPRGAKIMSPKTVFALRAHFAGGGTRAPINELSLIAHVAFFEPASSELLQTYDRVAEDKRLMKRVTITTN